MFPEIFDAATIKEGKWLAVWKIEVKQRMHEIVMSIDVEKQRDIAVFSTEDNNR